MFINGFQDVTAGDTATALAQFTLKKNEPTANSYVTYELLDADGTIYASGQGSTLDVTLKPNAKVVESEISIPVPSNIPVTEVGEQYQVRLTLQLTASNKTELYSNLRVLPASLTYLGTADVVDLSGRKVQSELVVDGIPSIINALVCSNETDEYLNIPPLTINGPLNTADGYVYNFELDTNLFQDQISANLRPYLVIWEYILNGKNCTETAALYLVTPSVLNAVKDLMATINKAKTSLQEKPTFSEIDALIHLRRGADKFNAVGGVSTSFSMLNARGGIREYWLAYSEISALRAQYLYESETAFDFQGQSIQLSVDRTQYYESLASAIENSVQQDAKDFKQNAAKRGHFTGDGSAATHQLKKGAIGTVGATLSPVSRIRPWNPNSWLGSQRSIF